MLVLQEDQGANEAREGTGLPQPRRRAVPVADRSTDERNLQPELGPAGRPLVRPADRAGGAVLVVGCGALARELVELTRPLPGVDVACLPPELHNRPERIPDRVRDRIRQGRRDGYDHVFVAYADCGTGGLLEPVLAEEGVERLPGAHCYEFFAGRTDFARLADEEPATFWLTDFLARNFDRLVIRGLGIDRHPELEQQYFGNYRRVVYLSQSDDRELLEMARAAADRLGLAFEHRHTGYGELATAIAGLAEPAAGPAGLAGAGPADSTARAVTGAGPADPAARPATGAGPSDPAARPASAPDMPVRGSTPFSRPASMAPEVARPTTARARSRAAGVDSARTTSAGQAAVRTAPAGPASIPLTRAC